MKTLSIIAILIVSSLFSFSQNNCSSSFKVNNGNGTCGGTAELRLNFPDGCPSVIPVIDSVYTTAGKSNIIFSEPNVSNCGGKNGYISYCIMSGNVPNADVWVIHFKSSTCVVLKSNAAAGVLPVKFVSFSASLASGAVNCKWSTEEELNNDHFELERSFNGNSFSTVAYVFGAENKKTIRNDYQYNDKAALLQDKNIIYYRVKQVDIDGKIAYSNIVTVKRGLELSKNIEVSPNPFTESMDLKFESPVAGNAQIKILNVTGQAMINQNTVVTKGDNSVKITNLGGFTKGVYFTHVLINGVYTKTTKVVKY